MTSPTPQEPGARIVDVDTLNAELKAVGIEAAPAPPQPVLRTADEWCSIKGVRIVDPDGWRDVAAPAWETPISETEFDARSAKSTVNHRGDPAFREPEGFEEPELNAMAPAQDPVVTESVRFATGGYIKAEGGHLPGSLTSPPPFAGPPIAEEAPVDEVDRPIQGYCARCGQATLVLPPGSARIRCTYELCPDVDTSARVLDRGQQALSFLNLTPTPADEQRRLDGVQGPGAVLVEDLRVPTAHRTLPRDGSTPVYRWTCKVCKTPHESPTPEMSCSGKPGSFHRPEHADADLALNG